MKKETKVAVEAVKAAGNVLLRYWKRTSKSTDHSLEFKGTEDFAIAADFEAEAAMIRVIKKEFPNHSILSEETGLASKKSDYKWIIDPLDGTHNFAFGIPIWGTIVALEHKGKIILGAINLPLQKEIYFVERGKGAFLNGRRIHVSRNTPKWFMLTFGGFWRYNTPLVKRNINKLASRFYKEFRQLGCSAAGQALVAAGRTDAFVVFFNEVWGISAGALLVEEAGGKVTDIKGLPWAQYQKHYIFSNGRVHNTILSTLKN